MPYVTVISTIVIVIGGLFGIKDYLKKNAVERDIKMVDMIKNEINPLHIKLEGKEEAIIQLQKDLESMEDHLNQLEVTVARHTGVIDTQTPLIVEIRNNIEQMKVKIESIQLGLNIK